MNGLSHRIRAVIFRRDQFTCQLCRIYPEPIPRHYDGRSMVSVTTGWLEVDHIIGRAEGGSNDLRNLQTLCSRCNLLKASLIERNRAWWEELCYWVPPGHPKSFDRGFLEGFITGYLHAYKGKGDKALIRVLLRQYLLSKTAVRALHGEEAS